MGHTCVAPPHQSHQQLPTVAATTYAQTPPYNGTITFSNGTTLTLARMERPVLLFDEQSGRPTHLINGVQPFSHPYTFTLIQKVGAE